MGFHSEITDAEGLKYDAVLENPEILSHTAVRFELPESGGRELHPGHKLMFKIPEQFKHRIVRDVTLRHRKADKYCKDIGPDRHDPHGAYSLVELHRSTKDEWVGWVDPKGYDPIKFAEPRPASDPENEVLHDWVATVGKVETNAVRVTSTGASLEYSVSQIHSIEINFFPELDGVRYEEAIYCPGTSFIDIEGDRMLPTYGGGSKTEGIYRNALVLNKRREPLFETTTVPGENAVLENGGRLKISLRKGELAQFEIAIGDTEHLSTVSSKTGRKTRLGYAKLWVGIKKVNSNEVNWFIMNANVPPQGIISGSPHTDSASVNEGDELVVESRDDTSYIMGYRIATR